MSKRRKFHFDCWFMVYQWKTGETKADNQKRKKINWRIFLIFCSAVANVVALLLLITSIHSIWLISRGPTLLSTKTWQSVFLSLFFFFLSLTDVLSFCFILFWLFFILGEFTAHWYWRKWIKKENIRIKLWWRRRGTTNSTGILIVF